MLNDITFDSKLVSNRATYIADVVVIGGGAAGLFCAVTAARLNPNLKVVLLEKTSKLLSKVKVSGGGRCNVTHALFEPFEFSKRYPRGQNFLKKTLHQFSSTSTINWFAERGVTLKAEKDGRMFPSTNSSQTIVDCLLKEAADTGVEIKLNTDAKEVQWLYDKWSLTTATGAELTANYLVVASGGYPKGAQFQWLQKIGHSIAEPVPSLFTFNLPKHPITALMGVSATARVKLEGTKLAEEGPVLITHWGLSGPAILRLSAWGARDLNKREYNFKAHIAWLPNYNETTLKAEIQSYRLLHAGKKLTNVNFGNLPARLWTFLLEQAGIGPEVRFAELPLKAENALIKNLVDYVVEVQGKTTFKEEFVTAGGINLSEIDANTMQSKKAPNLFFAGEVLDVDGITGGFNFQHAWTSGWIAGKTIAAESLK